MKERKYTNINLKLIDNDRRGKRLERMEYDKRMKYSIHFCTFLTTDCTKDYKQDFFLQQIPSTEMK